MNSRRLSLKSPSDAINAGIAYLSENRKEEGLAVEMQLTENITMANVQSISQRFGVLSRSREMEVAQEYVDQLVIRTPSLSQIVKNLSGGNQQKTVIAKWLFCKSKILIFDEPTRGIDVGAKYAVYELIGALAQEGKGIILISSDPEDVREKLLRFARAGLAVATMHDKSYVSMGGVSMGIAGSIVDQDFFESYLGMRVEAIDMSEFIRRLREDFPPQYLERFWHRRS